MLATKLVDRAPSEPGWVHEIKVKKPDKDGVAVYFLFTDPKGRWKTLLGQQASSSVDIHVGESQIDNPAGGD